MIYSCLVKLRIATSYSKEVKTFSKRSGIFTEWCGRHSGRMEEEDIIVWRSIPAGKEVNYHSIRANKLITIKLEQTS